MPILLPLPGEIYMPILLSLPSENSIVVVLPSRTVCLLPIAAFSELYSKHLSFIHSFVQGECLLTNIET